MGSGIGTWALSKLPALDGTTNTLDFLQAQSSSPQGLCSVDFGRGGCGTALSSSTSYFSGLHFLVVPACGNFRHTEDEADAEGQAGKSFF